jgi:hypothetical protein
MNLSHASMLCLCALLLISCGGESPETQTGETPAEDVRFEAQISRAYQGDVAGPGILTFLPTAGFAGQGYFFVADDSGVRPHGVTLVLPPGTGPGRHVLESPAPLDIGTVPSVRVDRDLGTAVVAYQDNTFGFVDLREFPEDVENLTGAAVAGTFEFETQNQEGELIAVSGEFSFTVE